jgi:hypothetical protein
VSAGTTNSASADMGSENASSANTGSAITGSANTGSASTGNANIGSAYTGITNTGSANTGNANTGSANTGNANTGSANTDGANTGSAITGSAITGSANTGSTYMGSTHTGSANTGSANTGSAIAVANTITHVGMVTEQGNNSMNKANFFTYTYSNLNITDLNRVIPGDISNASLMALSPKIHVKTALQFVAQRSSPDTRRFLHDYIMQMYPEANLSIGNAKALYNIGKTSFINMRFAFKKTIVGLAQSYISNHER